MSLLGTLICRKLHTVAPEVVVNDVIHEMQKLGVSSILIAVGDILVGLLTERDIVRIIASDINLDVVKIKEVMTSNIITVANDTLLDEALLVMEINKIRHLVVVDFDEKPLGIITYTDIVGKLEEDFFKAPRAVKEYMSKRLETVPTTATISETIAYMHEKLVSCIVVVEGPKPVGIITERDVVKLVQKKAQLHMPVMDCMSSPIIQVDPSISLYEASRIMEQHNIRHLVVLNGGVLAGLITNTDIVKSIRDNYRSYLEKEAIRTRKILDSIHEGVVEIDGESYEIKWVNQAAAELFGYHQLGEAIGKNFIDLVREDDRSTITEDFLHLRARRNFQCQMQKKEETITTLLSYEATSDDIKQKTFYRILIRDITSIVDKRKEMEDDLRKQKEQFQALFENTTDAVVIFDGKNKIQLANQQFLMMFGYTMEEIKGSILTAIVDPQLRSLDRSSEEIFLKKAANWETHRYMKTGETIYVLIKGGPVLVDGETTGGYAVYADITDRKKIINELRDSEEKFRTLIESMREGMSLHELIFDAKGKPVDYRFIDVNPAFELHTGITKQHVCGRLGSEIFKTNNPPYLNEFATTEKTGKPIKIEAYTEKIGRHLRLSIFSPKKGYFATLFEDITADKEKEEKIQYLIYHDLLTGVYNRTFFDKKLKEIDQSKHVPMCIIMADVNGLKLVNDAFGHDKGDELIKMAASMIQEVCEADIVARIGGDEFAVILTDATLEEGQRRVQQLKERTDLLNIEGIQLSVAFGLGVKETAATNVFEVVKLSEVQMYNRKLMESQSAKNHLMTSLLKVLEEKSGESHAHCQRVMDLGVRLGKAVGLSEDEQEKLKILALLHDIGNITIPEHILKKPDTLTDEEWDVIKKHPESGYRIVSTIPEFSFVAEYILCHHERIDGSGYPRGLLGEAIPKIARVLAVVDAYEVMTREKAYRKAMSVTEAVEELKANAGTQFDRVMVDIFIKQVIE